MADTITECELRGATLCQILHWLAQSRVSSEQLTAAYLRAMDDRDPALKAFLPWSAENALSQARDADARRRADGTPIGRLDGVPVSVKDNIDVAGSPTTCGLPDAVPAVRDAAVVERLRGAGAVVLGKTTLDEGVLGADGKNAHFGDTQNPWRMGFTPGGSSAGAAVSVAAGLCAVAVGSDSLGSSRIPASYCGIYALKPTPGEISTRGLWPAARRLDSIGLLARSVDDLGVLLHVLSGYDADDPRSRRRRVELELPDWEPGRLRFGVLDLSAWNVEADVAMLFERALQTLQHELRNRRTVDFGDFAIDQGRRAAFFLIEAEMLRTYAARLDRVSPKLAKMLGYARGKTASDYAEADRWLDEAVRVARRLFAQIDVLVTPTTPQAAFAHAAAVPANQADFTCFANLAGCPALSLPMGTTGAGLPVGLQLVGPPGSDLRLLELAEVCAAALDTTPAYPIGA
jgi:aspartyl-tRNA(Asn)/glutamyl-tRNA(Gln) amidotransferase subunit A